MVKNQFLTVSLFVILLLFLTFSVIPFNAKGVIPAGTISLDYPEQTAEVGPGDSGIVAFTGIVTVNVIGPGQNVQLIVVELEAESQWPTEITPRSFTIEARNSNAPYPFTAIVEVPNFTSTSEVGNIVISGSMKVMPGLPTTYSIPEASGIINIAQYVSVSLGCDEPHLKASPGDTVQYKVRVENNGNADEKISFLFGEEDEFTEEGWTYIFSDSTKNVGEGKEENITITITVPSDAPLKTKYFTVGARVIGAEGDSDFSECKLVTEVVEKSTIEDEKNDNGETGDQTGESKNEESTPGFELSYLIITLLVGLTILYKFKEKYQ